MKTFTLVDGMDTGLRQWLFKNVGPIDDYWTLGFDNTLRFKQEKDATYFQLMFNEHIREGKFYSHPRDFTVEFWYRFPVK